MFTLHLRVVELVQIQEHYSTCFTFVRGLWNVLARLAAYKSACRTISSGPYLYFYSISELLFFQIEESVFISEKTMKMQLPATFILSWHHAK